MGKEDLKLESIHINDDVWYYEDPKGLDFIVVNPDNRCETFRFIVSWRKIKAALDRKNK